MEYHTDYDVLIVGGASGQHEELKTALEGLYQLRFAQDEAALMNALSDDADHIGIVLMEISDPGMEDTLRRFMGSRYSHSVPAIAVSNTEDYDLMSRCYELGVQDFLYRPLVRAQIRHRVISTIQYMSRLNSLHWRSSHDGLTGLLNQTSSKIVFSQELDEHPDIDYALCIIDMDHFKMINDTHGHAFGDEVLRQASDRLQNFGHKGARFARYGGDEFLTLLPLHNDLKALADGLLKTLTWKIDNAVITPSIGLACTSDCGRDWDTLFGCADKAVFAAKINGRNQYRIYDETVETGIMDGIHQTKRQDSARLTVPMLLTSLYNAARYSWFLDLQEMAISMVTRLADNSLGLSTPMSPLDFISIMQPGIREKDRLTTLEFMEPRTIAYRLKDCNRLIYDYLSIKG